LSSWNLRNAFDRTARGVTANGSRGQSRHRRRGKERRCRGGVEEEEEVAEGEGLPGEILVLSSRDRGCRPVFVPGSATDGNATRRCSSNPRGEEWEDYLKEKGRRKKKSSKKKE